MESDIAVERIRAPPKIPEVIIPEDVVLGVASALGIELNSALAILRDIACGRDLKKFLAVCKSSHFIDEQVCWITNLLIRLLSLKFAIIATYSGISYENITYCMSGGCRSLGIFSFGELLQLPDLVLHM